MDLFRHRFVKRALVKLLYCIRLLHLQFACSLRISLLSSCVDFYASVVVTVTFFLFSQPATMCHPSATEIDIDYRLFDHIIVFGN